MFFGQLLLRMLAKTSRFIQGPADRGVQSPFLPLLREKVTGTATRNPQMLPPVQSIGGFAYRIAERFLSSMAGADHRNLLPAAISATSLSGVMTMFPLINWR